jgi:SPP1 gp7 family putative phage head morphogenesis protein
MTASLSFQEAVDYAAARDVVLPDDYYSALFGLHKSQAVSIAGLGALEQVKFVIDLVVETLAIGKTFQQFQEAVAANELGINLSRARLDNIFRTNMQVAFNHGRWKQQERVASTRPYLLYSAIQDSRVRPAHLAFNGTILPRDHSWWGTHYPPCGYRCRCTVISLTEAQAIKRGGVTASVPTQAPDPGWDFNPGVDYEAGVAKGLEDFGAGMDAVVPSFSGRADAAKARIRDASNAAIASRDGAPKRP